MDALKLKYPKPTFDASGLKLDSESPKAAAKQITQRAAKSSD
jgi:hypothetical protein